MLFAALAAAQSDRGRDRVEGRYLCVQRDGSIRRTLRIDRNGDVEIVTETRDRRDDAFSDRDRRKYGTTAKKAFRGRPVRHLGRSTWRDSRLVLLMQNAVGDVEGPEKVDLPIDFERGDLVVHRDSTLYGDEKMVFRRDGDWGGNGNWNDDRADFGYVEVDRDRMRIRNIDLDGGERDARLTIRTDRRRIELRGSLRRLGDETTFRTDDGELALRMRGDRVRSIRGTTRDDGRRIEFGD